MIDSPPEWIRNTDGSNVCRLQNLRLVSNGFHVMEILLFLIRDHIFEKFLLLIFRRRNVVLFQKEEIFICEVKPLLGVIKNFPNYRGLCNCKKEIFSIRLNFLSYPIVRKTNRNSSDGCRIP